MGFGCWGLGVNRTMHIMNGNGPRRPTAEQLVSVSANISSWNKHQDKVWAWQADILALQETRLGALIQKSARRTAQFHGYASVWGTAVQTMKTTKTMATPQKVQFGGVAVLARDAACPGLVAAGADSHLIRGLHGQGRWTRAAIPVWHSGRPHMLHFASTHNEPQKHAAASARKERNLQNAIDDIIALGGQAAF